MLAWELVSGDLPGVQEHVKQESPYLAALVRPVDEHRLDRHGARRVHLARHHRVVREEAQLLVEKRGTISN